MCFCLCVFCLSLFCVVFCFTFYFLFVFFFFFQAEDGIRDGRVTGVQTCALPICPWPTFEQLVRDEIERARSLTLVFSVAEIQLEDYVSTGADAQDRDLALRRAVDRKSVV